MKYMLIYTYETKYNACLMFRARVELKLTNLRDPCSQPIYAKTVEIILRCMKIYFRTLALTVRLEEKQHGENNCV